MKMVHVLTKRLSALLVCDAIVFASLGAIVIVAFAEGGLALAAAAVIGGSAFVGISWYLGEALARLLQPRAVAYGVRKTGSNVPPFLRIAPNDLDSLSS